MPTLKEEVLMMLAEGVIYLLRPRTLFPVGLPYDWSSLYTTIHRLVGAGLVRKEKRERKIFLRLTDQGKLLLKQHRACRRESFPAWDHRWRVVIFDVPEKRGDIRLYLRSFLKTLGFGKVQKSVWISPHDFEKQVREFSRKLDISPCIFQLTVERFSGLNERELARSFWDIRGLHDRYQALIQLYSREMERMPAAAEDTLILRTRIINNLMWDYQTILAQDPQLPSALLPADWIGFAARRFANRCHNSIARSALYREKPETTFSDRNAVV